MKADVLKFTPRKRAPAKRGRSTAGIIMLPSCGTPHDRLMAAFRSGKAAKRPAKRLGSLPSRRALNALQAEAWRVSAALGWLRKVAKADPDPRAIDAMLDEWDEEIIGDVVATLEWLDGFRAVWERRMARRGKPKLVTP